MEKMNVSFLLIDDTWQNFLELYISDSSDAPVAFTNPDNTAPENYELIGRETITIGDYTFEKEITSYSEDVHRDYSLYTKYTTVIGDKHLFFNCYYYDVEAFDTESQLKSLDNNMLPVLKSISEGNATAGVKEVKKSFSDLAKTFSFSIWILILPLGYILLCGMKIKDDDYVPSAKDLRMLERGEIDESEIYGAWQKEPLGLKQSKALLGFFAVLIVMHHLVQTIGAENASIFKVLENFGVCFVGAFFFYSGYGLMKSTVKKEGYLKGFFKKRFPTILIPFYLCTFIFLIVDVCMGKRYSIGEWAGYLTGWILRNTHMWYIVEIAFIYLAFYICMRCIKNRKLATVCIFAFLTALTVGSLLLCHGNYWFQGEWWYNSTLLFFFGILIAQNEEKVLDFFKKHYIAMLVFCVAGFGVFTYTNGYMLANHGYWTESATSAGYADKFLTLGPQLTMTFFFVLLLILISLKCRFENRALDFLGKISLELYLIHNLFIMHFDELSGIGIYIVCVLACSIVSAALLHNVVSFLLRKINKRPRPPKKDMRPVIKAYVSKKCDECRRSLCFIRKNPKRAKQIIFRNCICILLCAAALYPICIMFINSTRTSYSMIHRGFTLIPEGHFLENYNNVMVGESYSLCPLPLAMIYSLIVALSSGTLAVYFGSMCAYGFEMFRFCGKKHLWNFVIAAMMFSQISTSVGFFKLTLNLGLLNTLVPLIIPAIATPSTAYFMRMYLKMIPLQSIVESARIDGCSELGIFHRMILPAIKPALCLQFIFTFTAAWNNGFMHSLILIMPEVRTIATLFEGPPPRGSSGSPEMYVFMILFTLPTLIVYVLFSKSIVSRIVLGSVKE
nr:acyltransferase family protein [Lachnospiraceae bacterium]